MAISDKQLDDLIVKAEDTAEFNKIPADKVIITRTAFQTLLADLKAARTMGRESTIWMDVATELADDYRAKLGLDNYEDAEEGSSLAKFHELAIGVETSQ
jgi:ribosome assembly protein YihI (activator of Der GTPase)